MGLQEEYRHGWQYIKAIRILLAIAAFYDYEIWQMDVKTSFLNGHLRVAAHILGIKIIRDRSKQLIALSQSAYLEKILRKFRWKTPGRVASHFFWQWHPFILTVGTTSASGNFITGSGNALCILFPTHDLEFDKWLEAMNTEIQSMKDNQVWYLVDLPSNGQTVGCKWLFKKNTDMDGNMENSREGYTLMMEKPNYRNSQGAKTPVEVQRMRRVPYALAVGYVFVHNGRAMDWKSVKQSTTAMSSTEAEYIAAAEASIETVWIRKFIDGSLAKRTKKELISISGVAKSFPRVVSQRDSSGLSIYKQNDTHE
nr:hypothetical protein [Tanacetum cinerariifolium]